MGIVGAASLEMDLYEVKAAKHPEAAKRAEAARVALAGRKIQRLPTDDGDRLVRRKKEQDDEIEEDLIDDGRRWSTKTTTINIAI